MPFSSLSGAQRVAVMLSLIGGPQFRAQMGGASAETMNFARAVRVASGESMVATRKTWLQNQAMFTLRRLTFYATLGFLALGAEALRLGFRFDSVMQTARIAMTGFLPSVAAVNKELHSLFAFAAYTPFQFTDIVLATRKLLPFTHNIKDANSIVKALVDSLSAMGVTTPAALNRAALAMSHLLGGATLTGQIMTQLRRDNIPLLQALAKHYNTTTDAIQNMVHSGLIPSLTAAKALEQFINTTKGWKGAALRLQLGSLTGAFTTFKDIIMSSFGSSEKGMFGGIQRLLKQVDTILAPKLKSGANISLFDLFNAFNKTLTPKSNLVINTFVLLRNVFAGLVWELQTLGKMISWVLWPLDLLGKKGHGAQFVMMLLGRTLSVLIFLFAIQRARMLASKIVTEGLTAAQWMYNTVMWRSTLQLKLYEFWILRAEYAQLLQVKAAKLAIITTNAWNSALFITAIRLGVILAAIMLIIQYQKQIKDFADHPIKHIQNLNKAVAAQGGTGHEYKGGWWDPATWLAYPVNKSLDLAFGKGSTKSTASFVPKASQVASLSNDQKQRIADGLLVHTQVIVDRRVLADSVSRARTDKQARK